MDKPHVLIVDDSAVIRRLLSKRLDELGMRVTQAEDGKKGLDIAFSQQFDLIISDVEMPHLDGFSLCKKIKDNPTLEEFLSSS